MQKLPILATIIIFTLILAACVDKPTDVTDSKISVISISPTTAWRGDTITITGKNFGGWGDGQTLLFDTLTVTPFFVSDDNIKAILPATLSEKSYQVYIANKTEKVKAGQITISKVLYISSIQPATAWRGDTVTVNGRNFGLWGSSLVLLFDSLSVKPFFVTDNRIQIVLPQTVNEKIYQITIANMAEKAVVGHITVAKIVSISNLQPTTAWRGDTITIRGKNFGTSPVELGVFFDEIPSQISLINDKTVQVIVPPSVTEKSYAVTVRLLQKPSVAVGWVTMKDYTPILTSIQPTKARCFDTVTINGKNFGTKPELITIQIDNIKISPINVIDTRILIVIPSSVAHGKKSVSVKSPKIEVKNFGTLEILEPQWGDFSTVILSFRLHGDSTFKVPFSSYQYTDTTVERTVALENTMVSGKLPASYSDGKLHYTYQFSNSEYIPDVPGNPKVGGRGYTNKSSFVATIDTFSKTISNVVLSTTHTVSYSSMGPAYPFSVVNGLEYNLVIGTYKEIENGIEILFSADALNMLPQNSIKYYLDGQDPAMYQSWKFTKAPPYASNNFIKVRMLRPK